MKNVTIFHSCHSDYVCFYAKDWIYCTLKVGQICSFVENHYGKMTEYSGKVSFQKKCVLILVLPLYKWNTYYRWKFTIHLMLCKTFHKSFKVSSFIFHITNYTKWTTARKHWEKNEELDQTDANFVHAGIFYGKLHSLFFLGYFDDRKSTNYFYAFSICSACNFII